MTTLHTRQRRTQANIARLAELFPNCVTEARYDKGELKRRIDFDLLRQELSSSIVEGPQERYHLNCIRPRSSSFWCLSLADS